MTTLAAFVICILLTLLIALIFIVISGGGFIFIMHTISAAIIQEGTKIFGRRLGDHSTALFALVLLFTVIQILFVSSLFFGLYWMLWGHAHQETTSLLPATIDVANLTWLIGLNKILMLTSGYFFCRLVYFRIKLLTARESNNAQPPNVYLILSLISFVLTFIYLIGSLYYLTDYPAKESIGILPSIAGCIYLPYLLYTLGRTFYIHIRYRVHISPSFGFNQAIQLIVGILYDFAFLYFFYQTSAALKIY